MKLEPSIKYPADSNYLMLDKIQLFAGCGDLDVVPISFIEQLSFALIEVNTVYRFPKLFTEIDSETCNRIIGLWEYLCAALNLPSSTQTQQVLIKLMEQLIDMPADYRFDKHAENDAAEQSFTPSELVFDVLTWGEARKNMRTSSEN